MIRTPSKAGNMDSNFVLQNEDGTSLDLRLSTPRSLVVVWNTLQARLDKHFVINKATLSQKDRAKLRQEMTIALRNVVI